MKKSKTKIWPAVLAVAIASVPLVIVLVTAANERRGDDRPDDGGIFFDSGLIETDAGTQPGEDVSEAAETPDTPSPTPPTEATPSSAPTQEVSPVPSPTPEAEPTPEPEPTPSPMPSPAPTPTPAPAAVININESDDKLTGTLDKTAKEYNCASVSLAFYNGEGTFYTYQYGFADKSEERLVNEGTKFRVASLSKIVPAICALSLSEAGLLDIDEDISAYLGYTVRNPGYPDTPITPRMLMQHTSSIYDSDAFNASRNKTASTQSSTRDLLDAGTSFRKREPGAGFRYTNFGTSVLGAVCEMASGKLIDALARDVLFSPLGIDAAFTPASLQDPGNIATIYNANHRVGRSVQVQLDAVSSGEPGRDHHLVQGNLTISAIDYARMLKMLCDGGVLDGVRILEEQSVKEIHNADIKGAAYMQGLSVRYQQSAFLGENVYWHTGSAYGELTQYIYNLETGKIAVILTTGSKNERQQNGMVIACTKLAEVVWELGRNN